MRRKVVNLLIGIFLLTFFITLLTEQLVEKGQETRLQEHVVSGASYRSQKIGEKFLSYLQDKEKPGRYVALYLLETNFGYEKGNMSFSERKFHTWEKRWKKRKAWESYLASTMAIWDDVKYFPIPKGTKGQEYQVSYADAWMAERTYGGKRGHEGTDLMAKENVRGLYPVLSMTDGVVTKKGWLPKGGYRIGIQSPQGAYFYYAHLDSYAKLEVGDEVKAGDILGFMGDSGYGPEGTTGKFPVHLHLGIYIYPEGKEVSINPYWILRYIEKSKVKCYTEM